MAAPTANKPALLSPDQLLAMSPSQQQAYLNSLSPADQATAQQSLATYVKQINAGNTQYLQQSIKKWAVCPPTGGGTSATYASGTTLNFNFPTAGGAFLSEIVIAVDIKFTPASGSSATYGWTPAGAYAWFSEIDVLFNGQQIRTRPYFIKVLDTIRRKLWLPYQQVLSGLNADSTTTNTIAAAQPSLTGGSAATSKFYIHVPMQLHPLSPIGMLPMQGQGTKGQINLVCASTLGAANPDPMLVPINYTGGSGNGITLDSTEKTITVFAIYTDGTNLGSKSPLPLHLEHLPTAQMIIDQQLTSLTSGTLLRQRISTLLKHYYAVSVIIDGGQSTAFAATSNIAQIELDQDAAGQNKFWLYGTPNNTSFLTYQDTIRRIYGQDLDAGVVIWADATQFGTVDPDNRDGHQVLDMTSGHWTDVNYGVQVTTATSSNFTPRVETFLWSLNDAGLVLS